MGAYCARSRIRFSRSLSASSPVPDSFCRTRSSSANRKLPLLGRSSPRVEAAGSQPQTEQARAGWNDARATVTNVNRPTKNERMEKPPEPEEGNDHFASRREERTISSGEWWRGLHFDHG